MNDLGSVDPKDRYGKTAESWGNLLLPEAAATADMRFRFEGEGDATYRVSRVNVFPQDPAKRLYYYFKIDGDPGKS